MKTLQRLEVLAFMAVLICPTLLWASGLGTDKNLENREFAPFPTFSLSDPAAFVSGLEAWYSDRTPFKNEAVRLQNTFDYRLFHTTENKRVLVGDDGWLFYASVDDGDPVADYKGIFAYGDEDLEDYATTLERAHDNLADQGIELCMLIAPNKEIAYQRHMPTEIARNGEPTRSVRLVNYFKERGIDYGGYLDSVNQAAASDETLYYHLDTHWNLKGAYVGYREFCDLVGATPAPASFTRVDHTGGDLATMLNMPLEEVAYYQNDLIDYETDASLEDQEVKLFRSTWAGADPRNVLILSDSFRESFEGFVGAGFAHTASMARYSYTEKLMGELPFKPDLILVLMPERYVNKSREVLGKLSVLRYDELA